jgi:hypothetical protein
MGVDFIRLDMMHGKAREREVGPADSGQTRQGLDQR